MNHQLLGSNLSSPPVSGCSFKNVHCDLFSLLYDVISLSLSLSPALACAVPADFAALAFSVSFTSAADSLYRRRTGFEL